MTKAVIIEIKRDHNNTPSYVVLGIPRFLSTKADRRSDHITSKHASHARHHASRVPYHVRLRIGATARRWGSPALRICQRESRPGEASDRGRTRMLQRGEAVSANGTTLSASANRWRRCGYRQAARTGSHKLHAEQNASVRIQEAYRAQDGTRGEQRHTRERVISVRACRRKGEVK